MKFEITKDGNAVTARRLGELTRIAWTEVDMQYVLGLNPKLLKVSDALPVGLDGGGTERMSDMLYVDEVGRATVVELKNERASLKDLAQLLGYADHERHLPGGETERRYLCAEHGWNSDWLGRALKRVRDLARTGRSPGGEKGTFIPLHLPNRETFQEKAAEKWGDRSFSLRGSPPRSILISTDCSSCDEFSRLLQERWVNVRLVDADLLRSADGRLVLDWKPHDPPREIDLMWEATRCLWQDDFLRKNFEPNGWAEHRWGGYVSFSAKESGRVRFYLREEEGGSRVCVETWVPDKWCEDSEKRRLNRVLKKTLADAPEGRLFSLPKEQFKFVETTREVARAVLKVLTPGS